MNELYISIIARPMFIKPGDLFQRTLEVLAIFDFRHRLFLFRENTVSVIILHSAAWDVDVTPSATVAHWKNVRVVGDKRVTNDSPWRRVS